MKRKTRNVAAVIASAGMVFVLTACNDDSSQDKEQSAKQKNYDRLVSNQPANPMQYSPTRDSINKWVDTWGKKGKLSYVYIQNANGEYGYFIMKGLPVPRCKMLTPTEKVDSSSFGKVTVDQPGMDGAFSSGSTCNAYYGFDATTDAYMEFTVGMNQSFFLFDKPVTLPEFKNAKQMGPSSMGDMKN